MVETNKYIKIAVSTNIERRRYGIERFRILYIHTNERGPILSLITALHVCKTTADKFT